MIRETYKGRQLKVTKGKSYGKSRIVVNGTECGEWLGTQADVIEWAKRTIDDVDSRPFEGRWAECWYAPGTYELNEIGHVAAPGGVCSCDLCKTEPWNSCQNITAGGVCVCDHCMKPYLADSAEQAEEVEPKADWNTTIANVCPCGHGHEGVDHCTVEDCDCVGYRPSAIDLVFSPSAQLWGLRKADEITVLPLDRPRRTSRQARVAAIRSAATP
jgi:hypothetical protein